MTYETVGTGGVGNGHGDPSSNPGRRIPHNTNALGKNMNPTILPPAKGK